MSTLGQMFPPGFCPVLVSGIGAQQSVITPQRWRVWNRTGSATVVGQLCQFDIGYSAAVETVANTKGLLLPAVSNSRWMDEASPWRNVVVPAAAPFFGTGYACIAEQAVGDNEEMDVTVVGDTYMRIGAVQGGAPGAMLFTTANWTDATKTITKAGAFTSFIDPASLVGIVTANVLLTAGTGVTLGQYAIATRVDANNITTVLDINGAGGNIADTSIAGELYLTYPAGSKIEMAAAVSYGNLTNGSATNRKVAFLAEQTTFTNAISLLGGQLVHVLFNGWGFGASKL